MIWNSEIKDLWIALPIPTESFHDIEYLQKKTGLISVYKIKNPRKWDSKTTHGECEWHKMPKGVYEHKQYPVCKCGQRYVPIDDSNLCIMCQYNNI